MVDFVSIIISIHQKVGCTPWKLTNMEPENHPIWKGKSSSIHLPFFRFHSQFFGVSVSKNNDINWILPSTSVCSPVKVPINRSWFGWDLSNLSLPPIWASAFTMPDFGVHGVTGGFGTHGRRFHAMDSIPARSNLKKHHSRALTA